MNYTVINFLEFLGSFGIFIIGLKFLSEGLQNVARLGLRNLFKRVDRNNFYSYSSGLLITAITQSSSSVIILVVSLVNAGILKLKSGYRMVVGANLGTVSTIWLLAFINDVDDIVLLVLPIIGLTAPLLFSGIASWKSYGQVLSGVCFMFIGIHYMRSFVPDFENSTVALDFFKSYSDFGVSSILLFVLIGILLTVVVQSSTAALIIFTVIFSSSKWMIPVEVGIAMIIGANVGTTLTAVLVSRVGRLASRKVAVFHTFANLVVALVMISFFQSFVNLVDLLCVKWLGFDHGVTYNNSVHRGMIMPWALAVFHTIFNVFLAVVMGTLINPVSRLIDRGGVQLVDEVSVESLISSKHIIETPEIAHLEASRVLHLLSQKVHDMLLALQDMLIDENEIDKSFLKIKKAKDRNDVGLNELLRFLKEYSGGNISQYSMNEILVIQNVIKDLHNINGAILKTSLILHTKLDMRVTFSSYMHKGLKKMVRHVVDLSTITVQNIENPKTTDWTQISRLENEINIQRDKLRIKHLERIEKKKDIIESGLLLRSVYSSIEKIADHIYSINESITVSK